MAQIKFNISTQKLARVINAISQSGFERSEDESDIDFVERYTKEHFSELVFSIEQSEATLSVRKDQSLFD